ncbi:uncharacterized protein LOC125768837 isoform X3 [Anopheles funestus]|uniref:uncharacterized protein LOC125768837 isoform X3 n=1 Tax=Anopheles funestus TaxID=62324 RepID=UPI0020C68ABD|nr:uncharacterized protein LOC125768837 isoform X3 [Anopheles funestus]
MDDSTNNRYGTRSAANPTQLAEASTTIKQEPIDEDVPDSRPKEPSAATMQQEASSSNCSSRDPLADEIEFGETGISFQNAFFNVVGNEIKTENIIAEEIEDNGDIVGSSTKRRKICEEDSGDDSSATRSTQQSIPYGRMARSAEHTYTEQPANPPPQTSNSTTQLNGKDEDNCTYVIQVLNDTPKLATEQAQPKERLKTVAMTQRQMLHFIRLVEERDVLWNRSNPEYKDLNKQADAWTEISNIIGIPTSRLVEKWRSLYGSYRCYLSKVLQSMSSDSSKAISKPSWFAYDAMNFMRHISYTKSKVLSRKTALTPARHASPTDCDQNRFKTDQNRCIPRTEQPVLEVANVKQSQEPCTASPQTATKQIPDVPGLSTPVIDRNSRKQQIAELLANETETLERLRTLTNHTIQQTMDVEAAQFGHTVTEIVKHIAPERRKNLFSKMIEIVHNQYTFDQDVLQYGRAIMHLMQNMAKSKRKSTYNGIIDLINNRDKSD